jgi:hypothetical protein
VVRCSNVSNNKTYSSLCTPPPGGQGSPYTNTILLLRLRFNKVDRVRTETEQKKTNRSRTPIKEEEGTCLREDITRVVKSPCR